MSQGQARRDEAQDQLPEPITYGDIFDVSGSLAAQAITPQDAALMQSAETRALGKTLNLGAAAVMQAAAEMNESAGLVNSRAEDSGVGEQSVTVAEAQLPGVNVLTESVAGQAIRFAIRPAPADYPTAATADVTIGEALEATAMRAGDKPVELSDAVAIQAAERQATGTGEISKGGVASAAQSAADVNARLPYSMKTTLGDVLSTATEDLPVDKAVTAEDARRIKELEASHTETGEAYPGGVGDAMEAAAKVNEQGGMGFRA
nr:seed maturation protein SMP2 [Pinus tabuliformis]